VKPVAAATAAALGGVERGAIARAPHLDGEVLVARHGGLDDGADGRDEFQGELGSDEHDQETDMRNAASRPRFARRAPHRREASRRRRRRDRSGRGARIS
jgi:hypothetical protein